MPHVAFLAADSTRTIVPGDVGQSVMEVARRHGIVGIVGECGGSRACGTCHVYVVDEWREKSGMASTDEDDMLDFVGDRRPGSRLSCQIRLTAALDGLVVQIPDRQG